MASFEVVAQLLQGGRLQSVHLVHDSTKRGRPCRWLYAAVSGVVDANHAKSGAELAGQEQTYWVDISPIGPSQYASVAAV